PGGAEGALPPHPLRLGQGARCRDAAARQRAGLGRRRRGRGDELQRHRLRPRARRRGRADVPRRDFHRHHRRRSRAMSHALVIASRELAEKRFVVLAAAAFALIAVVIPLLPVMHGNRADGVVAGSMILATAFAVGLATILGATIVGRDLTAGRMSFYFARPIGGAAIWFGKLAASAVLVAGSFFIAVVPALVAGPMTVRRTWSGNFWQIAAIVGIAAVVLFFAAHALTTMVRSRSPLIAADFVAVVLVLSIAPAIMRPLGVARAVVATVTLGRLFTLSLLVAAIGAGTWQLIDGRSDRRRSHRAFSLFFWSAIAVALVLASLFVAWILSAKPSDLTGRMTVLQAPQGDAAILTGDARHRLDYRPTFLDSTRLD